MPSPLAADVIPPIAFPTTPLNAITRCFSDALNSFGVLSYSILAICGATNSAPAADKAPAVPLPPRAFPSTAPHRACAAMLVTLFTLPVCSSVVAFLIFWFT